MTTIGTDTLTSDVAGSRGMQVALWVGQLAVATILGIGAFAKFFNYTPEGSMALADALGVGRGTVTMIGAVETLAILLILLPRAHVWGALLAAATMGGALFSHATKIGWSGSAAAEMWPLAIVALIAASAVAFARRAELPIGSLR